MLCCTRIVINKSIAVDYRLISRVHNETFERLERLEGKLSRAVLRGGGGGNIASLPDNPYIRCSIPPVVCCACAAAWLTSAATSSVTETS